MIQLHEQCHDLLRGTAVEVTGGFVGQKDLGIIGQRTGNGKPVVVLPPTIRRVGVTLGPSIPRFRSTRRHVHDVDS